MKEIQPYGKVTWLLCAIVAVIIALIPFHAFLTVWIGSALGHYTLVRLWKELLLLVLFAGSIYLLVRVPKLRWNLISYKLSWLVAGYAFIQLLWGIISYATDNVTAKALAYGWLVNLRPVVFFLVVWLLAQRVPELAKRWHKLVFWPLVVVIGLGLLQYFVLPYDFLRHFGYSESTIFPYETINHNVQHLRAMSTLRGANPLGAYLVVTLSLIAAVWWKYRRWYQAALFIAGTLLLVLTFSRSAWIGFIVALAVIVWAKLRTDRARQISVVVLVGLLLIGGGLFAGLRHDTGVQDAIYHTDDHSKIAVSSNQGHVSAGKSGLLDLLHEPFGRGPGTAGPASAYNTGHPVRIAENYFLQLGQETGWLGLIVFVLINVVLARALWRRRHHSLSLGLFAALIGVSFVNLLSHAWTDDTLAYLWWGLAGMAIAVNMMLSDEIVAETASVRD